MPPVAPVLAVAGLNSMATRLTMGAMSRRSSSHLLPMVAFEVDEAGGVAAGTGEALHEAGADRIGYGDEDHRHVGRRLPDQRDRRCRVGDDQLRPESEQFLRLRVQAGEIAGSANI